MKKHLLILIAASFTSLMSCTSGNVGSSDTEEAKMTIEEKERANPGGYLSSTINPDLDAIGQSEVEGSVTNTATLVTYKDIVLTINFMSKTNSIISSEQETIYETVSPNQTKTFKVKVQAPENTSSIEAKVTGATPL